MSILKTSYETETDIPTGYADLFTEQGGKFVLTGIEGLKTERDTAALKTALEKERAARKTADDKVKKFEKLADKDPEALLALETEAEELRARVEELEAEEGKGAKPADKATIKEAVDKAVANAKKLHDRAIADLQKQIADAKKDADDQKTNATTLDGKLKGGAIRAALTQAALDAKVEPPAMRDVLMYAGAFEAVEDGVDAQGQPIMRVVTREGAGITPGLDPKSWLSDQRSTSSHWWAPSVGGGARGSDGKPLGENPFDKKNPNVSKAMQLEATDPAKALQLANRAGYATLDAAYEALGETDAKPGRRAG